MGLHGRRGALDRTCWRDGASTQGSIAAVLAVLEAFAVIAVVVAVGAIVGRTGVLGDNARTVLNRVAFHIGVPALLLLNLSQATLTQIDLSRWRSWWKSVGLERHRGLVGRRRSP